MIQLQWPITFRRYDRSIDDGGDLITARSSNHPFLTVFGRTIEEAAQNLEKALKEYNLPLN